MSEDDAANFGQLLGSTVGTVARRMESEGLSTGDMAELRRVDPEEPYTPALWKLMIENDLSDTPRWLPEHERERRWAALFMGMAMTAGQHSFEMPLGRALAKAGWSELRFVRLMRQRDDKLIQEIRRMAQFLGSKEQSADWTGVGHLLFSQQGDPAEHRRRSIARDYYRELYRQDAETA